ncbi:hypothetical protein [Hyphobacterium sp.]|uniref:hypothetical protein n=1 Tax=Hyphobacterium sp. TaxID=2004662 RepID=UPI003BAD8933
MEHAILIAGSLALFTSTAFAQDMDQFRSELAGLDGQWAGVLEYRDFRTDQHVQIPHARTIQTAPDGSYQLTQMEFTDPGYRVYSAELATFDGNTIALAYAGNGEASVSELTLIDFELTDAGWRAELRGEGVDAGEAVDVRFIYELDGDELTADKSVRSSDADPFLFRNGIRVSPND